MSHSHKRSKYSPQDRYERYSPRHQEGHDRYRSRDSSRRSPEYREEYSSRYYSPPRYDHPGRYDRDRDYGRPASLFQRDVSPSREFPGRYVGRMSSYSGRSSPPVSRHRYSERERERERDRDYASDNSYDDDYDDYDSRRGASQSSARSKSRKKSPKAKRKSARHTSWSRTCSELIELATRKTRTNLIHDICSFSFCFFFRVGLLVFFFSSSIIHFNLASPIG